LEACTFDAATGNFFVNNDGSAANPRGELDGYSAATFNALKATATANGPGTQYQFPGAAFAANPSPGVPFPGTTVVQSLGNCDPTGLALGPGSDIGIMCRQGVTGELLTFQILDKTSGTLVKELNAGGKCLCEAGQSPASFCSGRRVKSLKRQRDAMTSLTLSSGRLHRTD
jgi:hypothetical protein